MTKTIKCGNCGGDAQYRHSGTFNAYYCRDCGFYRRKDVWIEYTDGGSKYTPGHSQYGRPRQLARPTNTQGEGNE